MKVEAVEPDLEQTVQRRIKALLRLTLGRGKYLPLTLSVSSQTALWVMKETVSQSENRKQKVKRVNKKLTIRVDFFFKVV